MGDLSQQLAGLSDEQGRLLKGMEDISAELEKDGADRVALKSQLDTLAGEMTAITERQRKEAEQAENVQVRERIANLEKSLRTPSKAALIGMGTSGVTGSSADLFFWSVWAARNSRSPEYHAIGKANLEAMGSYWTDVPVESKATLGDTAAAGGNIVPPNVLESIITIATATNPYRELMNVVDAGFVSGVDVPTEGLAPTRATVQAYGATKTNIDFTVAKYSATMYTLAAIYDVGNQLLRNSRGAAENLVRSRLTRSNALGEAYYILSGTGSSEPKGILTSIGTSGTFVSSFTASATTLAGSVAAGLAKATGVLANRARTPDGVVVNASDFWIMAAQGTDTAGFFLSPAGGPSQIDPTRGLLRIWGLPVYADPNMPTGNLVVGEWKGATLYTGQSYRVDVSDQAGTRWDKNETGFRGEEEIGFQADPYVVAGLFQRITAIVP